MKDSLSLRVFFRQGEVALDTTYRDNSKSLNKFKSDVRNLMNDTSVNIQDIIIRSGASPEGSVSHNYKVSEERGKSLKTYLASTLNFPSEKISVQAIGEDWASLRDLVESSDAPDKEQILEIFNKFDNRITSLGFPVMSSPKKALMDLNDGRDWNWMLENIFPDLRSAGNSVVCRFVRYYDPGAGRHNVDTVYVIQKNQIDTSAIAAYLASVGFTPEKTKSADMGKQKKSWKFDMDRFFNGYRFAIKSNLLYDALAAPEIELEFPIGKRYSVMAEYFQPWYTFNEDRYCYQIQNVGAEGRYWFGEREKTPILSGFYAGIYCSAMRCDLEWNSKGYQIPWTWHAGVTGGWCFPIGKNDNWRIDLGLGLGVMPYKYDYYERFEYNGLLIYKNSGKTTWVGPTKLKCSIVWLLPMNKNSKKKEKSHE